MRNIDQRDRGAVPREAVLSHMDRIEAHKVLARPPALCRFLRFTVTETLEGVPQAAFRNMPRC